MRTNTLGQIRRGTQGTGTPLVHAAGVIVVDASIEQTIPGVTFGNITVDANTAPFTVTTSPTYKLKLPALEFFIFSINPFLSI